MAFVTPSFGFSGVCGVFVCLFVFCLSGFCVGFLSVEDTIHLRPTDKCGVAGAH